MLRFLRAPPPPPPPTVFLDLPSSRENLTSALINNNIFFYIRTVHLDTITVIYSPTNAQVIVLKTILKFALKQLRHVAM